MPTSDTLHGLLEASAARRSEHTAVEDAERDTAASYADLNDRAGRFRDDLVRLGVRPGDRVGIYASKSIGTVTAIFGILKAGAAYVPVDPGAPPERNAFIFRDGGVRAAVVERSLVDGLREAFGEDAPEAAGEPEALAGLGTDLALLDAAATATPPVAPAGEAEAERLSYILYTSGSTGKPKGVMHTHRSALSFVDWCSDAFAPSGEDRFSSHAPFHFDLSILDLYVSLKHGATLVLIGEDLGKQPLRLAPAIAERRISVWYSTPSVLRLLTEYGRMDEYDYGALRVVHFAGEVFPIKQLVALQEHWPHPRYFNLYGPTETNVCTFYELPERVDPDRDEPFPIGVACSEDELLVVDTDERAVEPGEEGELYVYGGSVMLGYWNLPDRNARAFYEDEDGRRWYRTGDVVREAEDGNLLFVGRRDRMVKRRGYRVELGEIEAALYRHPDVTEAAVVARPHDELGVEIRAFLSMSAEKKPSLIAMKQFCAKNLPLYMIPDRFVFRPSLPKTSSDKIDYQTLKAFD